MNYIQIAAANVSPVLTVISHNNSAFCVTLPSAVEWALGVDEKTWLHVPVGFKDQLSAQAECCITVPIQDQHLEFVFCTSTH